MALRYRYVLFDLDGTLVDSSDGIVDSVCYALGALDPGRTPPDRDTVLMEVGKPLETIVAQLGYPGDPETGRRFADTYRRHYAEHGARAARPYPGVDETLAELRASGVRLAVVTTKHQTQAELTVAGAGIGRYLDLVRGWQEGRRHKPDPEPFLSALENLSRDDGQKDQVTGGQSQEPCAPPPEPSTPQAQNPQSTIQNPEPETQNLLATNRVSSTQNPEPRTQNLLSSALVVGDTEQDILGAKAAGIDSCAVTYGFRPAMMLRGLRPDYMVGRIIDVLSIVLRPLDT